MILPGAIMGYFVVFPLLGIVADRSRELDREFFPSVLLWGGAAGFLVAFFTGLTLLVEDKPGGRFALVAILVATLGAALIRALTFAADSRTPGRLPASGTRPWTDATRAPPRTVENPPGVVRSLFLRLREDLTRTPFRSAVSYGLLLLLANPVALLWFQWQSVRPEPSRPIGGWPFFLAISALTGVILGLQSHADRVNPSSTWRGNVRSMGAVALSIVPTFLSLGPATRPLMGRLAGTVVFVLSLSLGYGTWMWSAGRGRSQTPGNHSGHAGTGEVMSPP